MAGCKRRRTCWSLLCEPVLQSLQASAALCQTNCLRPLRSLTIVDPLAPVPLPRASQVYVAAFSTALCRGSAAASCLWACRAFNIRVAAEAAQAAAGEAAGETGAGDETETLTAAAVPTVTEIMHATSAGAHPCPGTRPSLRLQPLQVRGWCGAGRRSGGHRKSARCVMWGACSPWVWDVAGRLNQ